MKFDKLYFNQKIPKESLPVPKGDGSGRTPLKMYKRILLMVSTLLSIALVIGGIFMTPLLRETKFITIKRKQHKLLDSFGITIPGTPDLANFDRRLEEKGLALKSPVFIRVFKREFELELWMMNKNGRYELFSTYPICNWSGVLGPKLATGDKQAPEGFYWVDRGALNPFSRQHRSFNLGFPNTYDRAYGRSGHSLMVHGGCSSIGCFAMTDKVIDEIWSVITAAFDAGQKRFQVQVFPFRMTKENLAKFSNPSWNEFWQNLKEGHDQFEVDHVPPQVSVCGNSYVFSSAANMEDGGTTLVSQCR